MAAHCTVLPVGLEWSFSAHLRQTGQLQLGVLDSPGVRLKLDKLSNLNPSRLHSRLQPTALPYADQAQCRTSNLTGNLSA